MKALIITLGFGFILATGANAQDTLKNDKVKPNKEKSYNPKSNSKHNPNRKFGKERASAVQKRNAAFKF